MKKTKPTIVLAMLCLIFSAKSQEKQANIQGRIIDEKQKPIPSASVRIKHTNKYATSNTSGTFTLQDVKLTDTLVITFIGYVTREVPVDKPLAYETVILASEENVLDLVEISTGYQTLPKERASGSFTQIDNKTINRNVGINILDRLEAVSSGMILNRGLAPATNNPKLSIRGRSTIFANTEPLIVLDGFPYEGSIDQINPADITSITILKDAAAASIWGTRAGNGVIVLTSKNGKFNQPMVIEASSTLTGTAKLDIFYSPQLSASEYIDLEALLFSKGYYTDEINRKYSPLTQAVETFIKRQAGQISAADSASQIESLKQQDIRKDIDRHLNRSQVYRQYQLNLKGGGSSNQYYFSAGYDKNLESQVSSNYERISLNANNSYLLLNEKLKLTGQVNFSSGTAREKFDTYLPFSPYEGLMGINGESLALTGALRQNYIDTAGRGKLLDWNYRPLDEREPNQSDQRIQYKINVGADYRILKSLTVSGSYQYLNENGDLQRLYQEQDYYARNLINRYSSISGIQTNRVIPIGGIQQEESQKTNSQILRFQLSYNAVLGEDHAINAIAGYEGSDGRIYNTGMTLYGYDPETATNGNQLINPRSYYPYFYDPGLSEQITTAPRQYNFTNINQSYYTNIAYTYLNKYTLSASARKDESNIFGVKASQKGVPLWSTGLVWNIANESFYHLDLLPILSFRATYGYNGNTDKTISGLLTVVNYGLNNPWGSNYARILNPPNPSLTWEKSRTWNLGLDFASRNNTLNGSIDLYRKDGQDLIGNSPIAMQTGIVSFKGNTAGLRTRGLDLLLNSKNLSGNFQWQSTYLLSYASDKVTSYKAKQGNNLSIVSGNYNNPLEGYPYNAVFSFPSAGLDANGAPRGYLNGEISKDYSAIITNQNPGELRYHGSSSPTYFGSLINTFTYHQFELSVNISYKLDYFFRRSQVFSGNLYTFRMDGYGERWQKPGDEALTKIPALNFPANNSANSFFQASEDLVEKADHIRLQDLRFAYSPEGLPIQKLGLSSASIFLYAKNMGLIWKATDQKIDPDYLNGYPHPLSLSVGINLKF
ncbi:SusC/RagA family TonB-linked outer membrane protein [Pedobacter psychroterrae]|nr:SusC/RagA family TonB-linked outer membrane protein [Pedobacter psychroterrae]